MRTANFFFEARVGNFARAEDLNLAALQPEIRGLLVGVKLVACPMMRSLKRAKYSSQSREPGPESFQVLPVPAVPSRPAVGPLQSPLQRTHHAVIVHRREPGLPVVHPLCVA